MYTKLLTTAFLIGLLLSCSAPKEKQQSTLSSDDGIDRTVLPIQPPKHEAITEDLSWLIRNENDRATTNDITT